MMPGFSTIDINCDMGEGIGNDEAIIPFISSANIACGFHAGDEETIRSTLLLCKEQGVQAGAHPSFADKENFGRITVPLSPDEIYKLVTAQLQKIQAIADTWQIPVVHVKPHGALYNLSAKDKNTAAAIAKAVYDVNPRLILFGLSGSVSVAEAKALGLPTKHEVFADRTYQDDGSLTPRTEANALITDVNEMLGQVQQLIKEQTVTTVTGKIIPLKADTVCIHGDGVHAAEFAKAIHRIIKTDTQ